MNRTTRIQYYFQRTCIFRVPKKCQNCGADGPLELHLGHTNPKWVCFDCGPNGKQNVSLFGFFAGMDDLRDSVNRLDKM